MSILFSSKSIGKLELPNRIIRAASHEGLADERGRPTEQQFRFYEGFVNGGVGLIITGYAGVMKEGKSALRNMTMIDSDDLIPSHRQLVDRIHNIGGRIILQIAHCGRQTWSGETGMPLVAPSAIQCNFYRELPEKIKEEEIFEVIKNFGKAAYRAREAGYDGIEIHGAHGYLLSTFLSRHANKREDQWGGSHKNRFRIVGEILKKVKQETEKDFPVFLKLNTYERARLGIKEKDCLQFAKMAEETSSCDALELSCGTNEGGFIMARGEFPTKGIITYLRPFCEFNRPMKHLVRCIVAPLAKIIQPPFTEGYNLKTAQKVKQSVSIPVITLGGMRSKKIMEEAVESDKTDFVSMARPLIQEPDLPNKFRMGKSEKALCNNCNICVVAADTQPIQCYSKSTIF